MGLFHHQPFFRNTTTNPRDPFTGNVNIVDQLVKSSAPTKASTAALATTAEIDAFKNTYRDTQPQKPLHACAYSIHRDVIGRLGHQVWSLTQLHSVGYWQSTFTVNK